MARKDQRVNYQIEAILKVHPKKYGKVFYVSGGENMYGNSIEFKDIVEYAMNPKKRLMVKLTVSIKPGKSKGELNSGQDYRADTKILDYISNVYGINMKSVIDVSKFVRNNLIELGIDPIKVDKDYFNYLKEKIGAEE